MAQRSPDVEPARAAGGFSSSQVFAAAIPTPCGPPGRAEPCGGTAGGHPQAGLGRILLRGPGSSCQGSSEKGRSPPGGGAGPCPSPADPRRAPRTAAGRGRAPPGFSGLAPLRRLRRRLSTAHAPEHSTPPRRLSGAHAHKHTPSPQQRAYA